MLSDRCLSCPVCLSVTLVYCGPTVQWIKMKFGTQLGLRPGQIVLDGHSPPNFRRISVCGQMDGRIKMSRGKKVGLDPGDIVLDGNSAPPPGKGGRAPNFRPMSVVAKRLDGSRCHLVGLWR